jgi:hypothetical protein
MKQHWTANQSVTWKHQPRGGYGYIFRVPATITAVGEKRIRIRVQKVSGEWVEKWVRPENLEPRTER